MANASVRGRPIGPSVLSAQERAYLERQVRRHRVARSLSERCRVILRCADGLASKDVAAELGLHEHTVGKWRRRFLKDPCDGLLDETRLGRPRTIDGVNGPDTRFKLTQFTLSVTNSRALQG
jgi:transposase-like protein